MAHTSTDRKKSLARTEAARRRTATRRRNGSVLAVLAVAVLVGVGLTIALTASATGSRNSRSSGVASAGSLPAGYELTGETDAMGGEILVTPGTRSGRAESAGIVVDGAAIEMGHIPLAYAVKPTWTIRNTSERTVTLSKPKLTIVKGCCPGEFKFGTETLAPGEQTTLEFPLHMHPGMDGYHDFRVAVPISTGNPLDLSVTGDFT